MPWASSAGGSCGRPSRSLRCASDRDGRPSWSALPRGPGRPAYALVVNIARRQMSKGSMAMVAAKAFMFSEHERGEQAALARRVGVGASTLSHAAYVLEHAPEVADQVVAGARLLSGPTWTQVAVKGLHVLHLADVGVARRHQPPAQRMMPTEPARRPAARDGRVVPLPAVPVVGLPALVLVHRASLA